MNSTYRELIYLKTIQFKTGKTGKTNKNSDSDNKLWWLPEGKGGAYETTKWAKHTEMEMT